MALPNSYTLKTGAIPAYFDAILGAEVPERFSINFLRNLEFTSSNDRVIIAMLKELGFLNADGVPQERYYQFLDKSQSYHILADGIKEAYSDLFAVNKEAYKLDVNGTYNKLRTLYQGTKKDTVIKNIAKTFVALCDIADFSKLKAPKDEEKPRTGDKSRRNSETQNTDALKDKGVAGKGVSVDSLQYHINLVLPETRDQAVYDALFKSLRDHLG